MAYFNPEKSFLILVFLSAYALDGLIGIDLDGIGSADNKEGNDARNDGGDGDNQPEAPSARRERHVYVHAPKAGDKRRNTDDERDHRQQFHDDIHVVGDDRSKGVHRARQNAAVNVTHLYGLGIFDDHVVVQIGVFLAVDDGLQLFHAAVNAHIRAQRSGKIDQRFFQPQ